MDRAPGGGGPDTDRVARILSVRSEYTSARLIYANLEHRVTGFRYERAPGYLAPDVDYETADGRFHTILVRDYDVRFLDRTEPRRARDHLDHIHCARRGDENAREALERLTTDLSVHIAARFFKGDLVENQYVVPYTTERDYTEAEISSKGSVLLALSRCGFATPDFNFLTAAAYELPLAERHVRLREAIANLEQLSGRALGDPVNPLLIAMRSAMPHYLPGFMPTYLNVGFTPAVLPGLPGRYGEDAASRIRLSSRRTLLEALDPAAFQAIEDRIRHDLTRDQNHDLADLIEERIARRDARLLDDPWRQLEFFLARTYAYYDENLDALRNFMGQETFRPTMILQRMVCSALDRHSYAGVLFSRHPRLGTGVQLQYARGIYGEDLMTGRLSPDEVHLQEREEAREVFPAVHHFWPRLAQLEKIFAAPVMVEFTGVHGTFTILQVNQAELTGVGMLIAVMDLYRAGEIDAARVRGLIAPFHIRQLESDAIDPRSLRALRPFCHGISVLPRSAVTGRLVFDTPYAGQSAPPGPPFPPEPASADGKTILIKTRFTPTDAVTMLSVDGICSLSPAAIHVVTAAQNLGIPALLSLEQDGVRLGEDGRSLINAKGEVLREGDRVTISSRKKTLYAGQAVYHAAQLLRFMAGEHVAVEPAEQARFTMLAGYYRAYRGLLEEAGAGEFASLQDLGVALRGGRLREHPARVAEFVNRCYDANRREMVERLFATTLGMHLPNQAAFRILTVERRAWLLEAAVAAAAVRGQRGYEAGAFVIGCLVDPDAPGELWRLLFPATIAGLLDEWILHQKYRELLADVGEKKINRARDLILSRGLGELRLHAGTARAFRSLRESGVDLAAVRRALPATADPQTAALIDLLLA